MKKIIILFVILSLILVVGCTSQQPIEKDKLSIRLPVPVMGAHFTQYFSSIDQGYYAKENLDITFNFGNPETNPIKMVVAGVDDIGLIGSPDTIVLARSKGGPNKSNCNIS